MAAPSSVTMQNFNGDFVWNKKLSTNYDALFALQGVGFIPRKALSKANVVLTGYSSPTQVAVKTTVAGRTSPDTDLVIPDNAEHQSEHSIFGGVTKRSLWISDINELGNALELKEGWTRGSVEEGLLLTVMESPKNQWTTWSVWGFQDVEGQRKHVRLAVANKGEKSISAKMVYDYVN